MAVRVSSDRVEASYGTGRVVSAASVRVQEKCTAIVSLGT
jgi:hypothetical protein